MLLAQLIILLGSFGLALGVVPKDITFTDFASLSNLDISTLFANHDDTNASNSTHGRRWAPGPIPNRAADDVWEAAKCKGRKFMTQMSYSDFDAGQVLPTPSNTVASRWSFQDLMPWGYLMSGVSQDYRNFASGGYWGVADFFRHIGISDRCREEGGKWNAAVITHYQPGMPGTVPPKQEQTYRGPDGYVRRVSGAYFYMAVTPEGGIIVQNSLGPRQAADTLYYDYQDHELPLLRALSDMMWTMWEYYVPANIRANINFFMSLGINNPQSLSIIRRAMDSAGQQLSAIPFKFTMDTDGALALLGSPNGARVAHFLIQRKNQIGLKTVTGVHAFECQSRSRAPCLMFTVGPMQAVPRPQQQAVEAEHMRAPANNHYTREHVFRFDGNMTVSSRYV